MAGVRFELEGADEALAALAAGAAALERPAALHEKIAARLLASTRERFVREAGPDGSPWPRSLRAMMDGGRTLTDTAFLANSLAHEADDKGLAVGTNAIYAAIHQFGGRIAAKTAKGLRFRLPGANDFVTVQAVEMPARPFLGLEEADEEEIEKIVGQFLAAVTGQEEEDSGG